jgi:hypothetical protein
MKIRNRGRNDGMGIRGNLGLRVGWLLGFVDSCSLVSGTSEASPRAGEGGLLKERERERD